MLHSLLFYLRASIFNASSHVHHPATLFYLITKNSALSFSDGYDATRPANYKFPRAPTGGL